MRSLTLDSSVRRAADGRVLIGGSPLILLRLTAAGAALIDRIQRGEPIGPGTKAAALLDRLLDAGVVHPTYRQSDHGGTDQNDDRDLDRNDDRIDADKNHDDDENENDPDGISLADVTVVVPAFSPSAADLEAIVEACSGAAATIIVDDSSPQPVAAVEGATVIRRPTNGGPAAARASGLAHVQTPFVAFVDVDVVLTPGWMDQLLSHLTDARTALVAPRVSSAGDADTGSALVRYELVRSSLDLGSEPARVRAGTRVSYVPAAAMICRVAAIEAVGGFDPTLRFGEDVDLVWRLDEAGWRVRYEPAVVVHHRPRQTVGRWMRQRYSYGASAAALAERHPGALAPVRVSGWSAATWAAVVGGWPVIGATIATATTALLARKLRDVPDGPRQAVRLAGLGHLYAGRALASGMTRAWWPLTLAAALVSRRGRRAFALAAVLPALLDWRETRPALDPVTYTALRTLDDVSYGTGVLAGAVRSRSVEALRPDFRSWPNSGERSARQSGRPEPRRAER